MQSIGKPGNILQRIKSYQYLLNPMCYKGTMDMRVRRDAKKRLPIVLLVLVLLVCLIPIKDAYYDGGSEVYTAVLYKVIIWNEVYHDKDSPIKKAFEIPPLIVFDSENIRYRTGVSIYVFPFNVIMTASL